MTKRRIKGLISGNGKTNRKKLSTKTEKKKLTSERREVKVRLNETYLGRPLTVQHTNNLGSNPITRTNFANVA